MSSFSRAEVLGGTEDRDRDGMPDWWETRVGSDPARDDSQEDPDGDGLINIDEFRYGAHPFYEDTDEDGLDDGEEVHIHKTNPVIADTDGGGRFDGDEVADGRDPLSPDDDDSAFVTVSIPLHPGWNLISLPIEPSVTSIAEVLEPIFDSYSVIWSYQETKWLMYDAANPRLSDLSRLEAGWGYWVNMKNAATLPVLGSVISHPIPLENGWNLVGYNSQHSQNVTSALSSLNGKYVSVWTFVDGGWKVYDPENPKFSDLMTLDPDYGYWINAREACAWGLP
ncbi:MAG: hypothetical protein DRI57_02535 [Deltaproteobacteria bacterium]|nr:MAG: hypothetical protein DRI57_02535 [Deltaproteobacteria bacterium]